MSAAPALALSPDEREPLAAVAEVFAAAVPADRAGPYRALARAAREGEVPEALAETLDRVCELGLQTGKARELGRAEAERALMTVFRRTRRGREASAALEDLNRALADLAGRRLGGVRASMRLPGRYTLALEVDGLHLTLGFGPEGIGVESLAAG